MLRPAAALAYRIDRRSPLRFRDCRQCGGSIAAVAAAANLIEAWNWVCRRAGGGSRNGDTGLKDTQIVIGKAVDNPQGGDDPMFRAQSRRYRHWPFSGIARYGPISSRRLRGIRRRSKFRNGEEDHHDAKLGPVGGRIVAEVFSG